MVPDELVNSINAVRMLFLEAGKLAAESTSLQTLLQNSDDKLRQEWKSEVEDVLASPRVRQKCTSTFTCAFVGSSNAGKTSFLREVFPRLAHNGHDCDWLVTNVTDTTSQALRIRYCGSGELEEVDKATVCSWSLEQIRRLVDAARKDHEKLRIAVDNSQPGVLIVDGGQAELPDRQNFKFALRQELRPLPRERFTLASYNQDTILGLTVKQGPNQVKTGPVLRVSGEVFHPLQLRAAVKEVELRDPFETVAELACESFEAVSCLAFLDTPGLNTHLSSSDEVLCWALGHKNQQIVTELLRNDELDLIVHLVLAGFQSPFGTLWKQLQEQFPDDLADLADRVVLAVNGFNRFLTEPDLTRYWKNGGLGGSDQFQDAVENNILTKMSSASGPFRPARICFLDGKNYVSQSANPRIYEEHRAEMERWTRPGGAGYATLQRLGLLDSFRENIIALCDPNDRGQGYLLRQIVDLIYRHGKRLIVRKHIIRSKLRRAVERARTILLRYYDPATGGLDKWQIVQGVIRKYFPQISSENLASIDVFYDQHLRSGIDKLMEAYVPRNGRLNAEVKWATFKLTDTALASLREDGIGDELLGSLKQLKGRQFENEQQFLAELARIPGAAAWKDVLLTHTRDCLWVRTAYKQLCNLVLKTAVSLSVSYRISQAVVHFLHNAGMSANLSRKLMGLSGRTFASREEFEAALGGVFTTEELAQWRERVIENSKIADERENDKTQDMFKDYLTKEMGGWQNEWGYRTADLPPPSQQSSAPVDLLRHILHLHAREMLYQLIIGANHDPARNTFQDEQDRQRILTVLQKLDQAAQRADQLCQTTGA